MAGKVIKTADLTQAGLNLIAQAISIYDGDLRLAVSNRRFQEMFDLPEELTAQIQANYYLKDAKSLTLARTHLGTQGDGNHFVFIGKSKFSGTPQLPVDASKTDLITS